MKDEDNMRGGKQVESCMKGSEMRIVQGKLRKGEREV